VLTDACSYNEKLTFFCKLCTFQTAELRRESYEEKCLHSVIESIYDIYFAVFNYKQFLCQRVLYPGVKRPEREDELT
jgi:hypothetical protein